MTIQRDSRLRWPRAVAAALLAMLALIACVPAVRAAADEDALRRRVQRFYVLSYLNRHGEMWELFTKELQGRMGGDKREYISSSRHAGFELYTSRIERVEMRGSDAGVVDVALQVKMPGSLDATWRRHRMAWRLGDDGWRYAGSLDITHEERDVAGQELLATPQVREAPSPDLLPPRTTLPPQARVSPAKERAPVAPPLETASGSPPASGSGRDPLEGDRWDLVAIPPDGITRPATPASAPAAEPTSPAAVVAESVVPPAPALPGAVAPQWLPPDRAAAASEAPAAPAPAPASPASGKVRHDKPGATQPVADDEDAIDALVRRVAETSGVRRLRALEKLRQSSDPRLPALAAQALAGAPASSQVVLLDRLAALGSREHVAGARALLTAREPDVRSSAFHAVGELGSEADAAAVVAALEREEASGPRAAGLRALGRLGGGAEAGEQVIARSLADGKLSDDERAAAAEAAGMAATAEAEPAIVRVLGLRRPYATFLASVTAAGRLATPATLQALDVLAVDGGIVQHLHAEMPVRLAALRALCAADVAGAGTRLAREMLAIGNGALAQDVDRVAETGETMALAELLVHGSALVRVRAADLLGRSIDDPAEAALAVPAVDRALAEAGDTRVLRALTEARQRLTATAAR